MLRELQSKYPIPISDLELIYNEFYTASLKRGTTDCRASYSDFAELLRKLFPRGVEIMSEIFNALDTDRAGFVDYKNFIIGLNMLRNGTLEQRLWFAFRAYDLNGNSYIEVDELFNLIKSATSKNLLILDDEI